MKPVFEAVHRLIWYKNIQEVKWGERDGQEKLLVYHEEIQTSADAHKFPDKLLSDERAKRALLAHESGHLALAMMSTILGDLLKGKS